MNTHPTMASIVSMLDNMHQKFLPEVTQPRWFGNWVLYWCQSSLERSYGEVILVRNFMHACPQTHRFPLYVRFGKDATPCGMLVNSDSVYVCLSDRFEASRPGSPAGQPLSHAPHIILLRNLFFLSTKGCSVPLSIINYDWVIFGV